MLLFPPLGEGPAALAILKFIVGVKFVKKSSPLGCVISLFVTLVSASTLEKELNVKNGGNKEAAKVIGAEIAKRAKKAKIKAVVFDRGGYLYHGRVQALAEAARENGLEF